MAPGSPVGPMPLAGIKVLEFAGLAPGPFAGLLLSDYGASVLRIDRPPPPSIIPTIPTSDVLTRHKRSLILNLKSPSTTTFLLSLLRTAPIDIIIDPFRPGVLESLGLGPDPCLAANPRLIYARLTGFPRTGKYAAMAGHDINYLSVSGGLHMLGRAKQAPYAPGNVLADFAGGGATLVTGILLALLAREKTGKGQVVEVNMVDGVSYLLTYPRLNGAGGATVRAPGGIGNWTAARGRNLLDGGAPFYDSYETKDGQYMAVGCLEPQFYAEFIRLLFPPGTPVPDRRNPPNWPELRRLLVERFKERTRKEWEKIFNGTDACVTPVKSFRELEKEDGGETLRRLPVELKGSPGRKVQRGMEGGGLIPGDGGEEVLREWCGWVRGREFEVREGVCCAKEEIGEKAKL
ncbi:CoA-transferase family III domain-containing protein [Kalaharituber pfeilii]|nr:CoA-transferase family III domain-containing protein [Kalaharituber pfeilii]